MNRTDLAPKFRVCLTDLFACCERWMSHLKEWDQCAESLVNMLEQMQSCEELEPEVIAVDPLLYEFPDLKEKLVEKLTVECETIVGKMRRIQTTMETMCRKMDKSYDGVESLIFHCGRSCCHDDDDDDDDESSVAFLTEATATCPSFTFMMRELKCVVDSLYSEVNRQDVVFELLSYDEPGRVTDK